MVKMRLKNLMMLVLSVLLVFSLAVAGGCGGNATETTTQIIEDITPQEAFTLIQNNPDFVILDVRTPEEVDAGYIENAINIDYYSDTFREELDRLDKNQKYLIYCRSGNRSGKASAIMKELNFSEVYNMTGGIVEWRSEGLPTVK